MSLTRARTDQRWSVIHTYMREIEKKKIEKKLKL